MEEPPAVDLHEADVIGAVAVPAYYIEGLLFRSGMEVPAFHIDAPGVSAGFLPYDRKDQGLRQGIPFAGIVHHVGPGLPESKEGNDGGDQGDTHQSVSSGLYALQGLFASSSAYMESAASASRFHLAEDADQRIGTVDVIQKIESFPAAEMAGIVLVHAIP